MLQIERISKQYITGDLCQKALDNVSLCLRDNEFVAILGPSGSGKTTLLNIIGGLDRYDSGEMIINGISTKKYKDKDWDSYRNHTIGFVFQSYNLIPHQSILSNVELALTISGISRKERKKRATEALEKVGLAEQLHKRPNQMSGGQMQRVAIARALVNDPDILLADEPTGALDTETSIQVMELLKEVAKDRLVVMVTHNPELAQDYATRIVKLRDGKIIDDSNPYLPSSELLSTPEHRNMGKSSMSFFTALSLSFNNLRTKKARTILTAFAGSIGIIGIALILSLSTGVKNYITNIQKSTMTSYPITLEAQTFDLSGIIGAGSPHSSSETADHPLNGVYANGQDFELASSFMSSFTQNNLTAFKNYLDDTTSPIHSYIGENGVIYSYQTQFSVFTYDPDGTWVNTDGSTLKAGEGLSGMKEGMEAMQQSNAPNFTELMPGQDNRMISPAVIDSYELVYGNWPNAYDEIVLTVNSNNEIAASTAFQLGFLPALEYSELMDKIEAGEQLTVETRCFDYADVCQKEFYLVPACDLYEESSDGIFSYIGDDQSKIKQNALVLKIVGVVRPVEEAAVTIDKTFGYTRALTQYLIEHTNDSAIVNAQTENPNINVLNGLAFAPNDDAQKAEDARNYIESLGITQKAQMAREMLPVLYAEDPATLQSMLALPETELAGILDQYFATADDQSLLNFYDRYISTGNYDDNMTTFGVVSLDAPSAINIYADSFEDKDAISECIEDYNRNAPEEDQISYTDYVGLLMSSVTTIVDVISYVLIAFVSVSLVVSSIMIGIITYISVLERTKEIGILRAIGASKRNISQVFNAETFIIGLISGLIGVGLTLLALIPINLIIHAIVDNETVNAVLPLSGGILLVILSVVLTFIGGLIPAKKAANKDPVTALRTE